MKGFVNALKKPKTWLAIIGVVLVVTLAVSLTTYGYNQWISPALDKVVNKTTNTESTTAAAALVSSII